MHLLSREVGPDWIVFASRKKKLTMAVSGSRSLI